MINKSFVRNKLIFGKNRSDEEFLTEISADPFVFLKTKVPICVFSIEVMRFKVQFDILFRVIN